MRALIPSDAEARRPHDRFWHVSRTYRSSRHVRCWGKSGSHYASPATADYLISLPIYPQRLDSTFGSARRTDHWKSVVVVVIVVGAADPPHRAVISRFTGGQRIDNTGHGVATSSCAPGAWSTLSRTPRAVRRSRPTICARRCSRAANKYLVMSIWALGRGVIIVQIYGGAWTSFK